MFKDLRISSPDIEPLGPIAAEYTLDDRNTTPTLEISGVPAGAAELAVICHDPDAPLPHGFTHWVLYGLPPEDLSFAEDAHERFVPGPNGAGVYHWAGPQPPAGHGPHHYYFWVYALSRRVHGTPTREEFLADYADSIIEQARFVGTFQNE